MVLVVLFVVNGTGSFVVSGLLKGTYPVKAVYLGDDLFDAKNASSNIVVNKISISSMTVGVNSPIYVVLVVLLLVVC